MNKQISFSLIGAGNAAHSLVPELVNNGFKVNSIISRSLNSAKDLAEKNQIANFSNYLTEINVKSDCYIISVSDDQITNVAEEISQLELDFAEKIFIHLSGSKNINALKSLTNKGGKCVSIHFMKSFPNHNFHSLEGCNSAIESNNIELYKLLAEIVSKLKAVPFRVSSENKALYHLSGVFALNFISANFFNARNVLNLVSENLPTVNNLFSASAKSVIENISTSKNLFQSLSGPLKRTEIDVVENHLELLKKNDDKTILLAFISNSLSIISLIKRETDSVDEKLLKIERMLKEQIKLIDFDI